VEIGGLNMKTSVIKLKNNPTNRFPSNIIANDVYPASNAIIGLTILFIVSFFMLMDK